MTDKAKRCVESCREWYQAFSNFGKGNEPSVKELLTTADLIESLAAELEQVKRERDAAVEDLRKVCKATEVCFCCENYDATLAEYVPNDCMDCIKHCNWKWRGVNEG